VALAKQENTCRISFSKNESLKQNFIETNCADSEPSLTIEGRIFGYMPILAPHTLKKFKVIEVKDTNIQRLGPFFVEGQFDILTELKLTNNRLKSLNDNAFAAATSLHVLKVSDNYLNELGDDCLDGLANLQMLDLSDNCITYLPDKLFEDLHYLAEVRLGDNNLQTLALDMFNKNRILRILYLERNNISSVEKANDPLPIEQLVLKDNNLKDASGLKSLDRMIFLDLSENPNLQLEDDSFESLSSLENLELRNVSLHKKQPLDKLFLPLTNIKKIGLARNRLFVSELPTFEGMTKLERIVWDPMCHRQKTFPRKFDGLLKDEEKLIKRRKFKNCPAYSPPEKSVSISLIIGLSVGILVVICTAFALVYYWRAKNKNFVFSWNLSLFSTNSCPCKRDLPELFYSSVDPNPAYKYEKPEYDCSL
jgi:Leucine rich repeat/Leucine Rich Repeat